MESTTIRTHWYAIKTRSEASTQAYLESVCESVYAPKIRIRTADNNSQTALRSAAPHLLFFLSTESDAIRLEKESRQEGSPVSPFWIYRLPGSDKIQPISNEEFNLFRLLTTDDPSTQCEIYGKADFHIGQHVRVTAGPFAGYTGYTRRIRNNKHVVVEIEGLCAIALPFIHPSLLQLL